MADDDLDESISTQASVDEEDLLVLKKSHFNLLFKANGKAELYFHCYFWTTYIDSVAAVSGQ